MRYGFDPETFSHCDEDEKADARASFGFERDEFVVGCFGNAQQRYKNVLESWLYVHVPLAFMLLAALTAHIVSVFIYW